jgi:nucleoside-diphosphate-sugar epimerase
MPETILVTGANSFIGGWIVKYLLDKGYNVRGTVRSQAKESQVRDSISKDHQNQISFVHVADITTDSFYEAVQGVDGIIHVASPYHWKVTDPEKDLLLPAINGTVRILQDAHEYNKSNQTKKIKRVVITSSFASVSDPSKGLRPGYTYTEKDWCPVTYDQGVAAKNDPFTVYRASKVCAERAAWEFIDKEKPSFTIATICEPLIFGPHVHGFKSLDDIHTSNASLWSLITSGKDAKVVEPRLTKEVDVRDVAYTHVAALERMTDTNERYLIAAPESWSQQKLVDIVHESNVIPTSIKDTTPIGTKGQQLPDHFGIDSSKAQKELGVTFIPFKKTIEDLMLQFDELLKILEHSS